jgi:hypothetical protein
MNFFEKLKQYGEDTTKFYENFKGLEEPVPFNEYFKNQDVRVVQVYCLTDDGFDAGFCGVFSWKDNIITPLDGDTYNEKMLVYGYRWFSFENSHHDEEKALNIVVGEDW